MVSPIEFARLRDRVDSHDETLRALSDTLLDVKETVDGHTVILDQHTATLDQHTGMLMSHGEMLTEILRRLPASQGEVTSEQGEDS